MEQVQRYAKNNAHMEVVNIMVLKGTRVAFFIYDRDYTSDHGLDLKNDSYQDLIGLHVTREGLSLIPQSNTYHPQLKIYDFSDTALPGHGLAITCILSYMAQFKAAHSINDNLTLPSNDARPIKVAEQIGVNQSGLKLHLHMGESGKFSQYVFRPLNNNQ